MFSIIKSSFKLLLGSWLIGLACFNFLVSDIVNDQSTKTDAIVVLTGSSKRIATGIKLLKNNLAPRLLISGVNPGVDLQSILRINNIQKTPSNLENKIELDYDAYDTFSNGLETQNWVKKHSIKSIRLVTANYHMPRSLLVFDRMMPKLKVVQHPVLYDLEWTDPRLLLAHISLFIKEYMKYTVVLFMHVGNKLK